MLSWLHVKTCYRINGYASKLPVVGTMGNGVKTMKKRPCNYTPVYKIEITSLLPSKSAQGTIEGIAWQAVLKPIYGQNKYRWQYTFADGHEISKDQQVKYCKSLSQRITKEEKEMLLASVTG